MIILPDERLSLLAQIAMWRLLTAQEFGDWESPFEERVYATQGAYS